MTRPIPSVSETTPPEDAESAAEFEALLAHLKQSRGFDFTPPEVYQSEAL